MKKIFILTGEPSGDKLASTVISKVKQSNPDIEYLSVGGTHLSSLGIKSIYDLKEVTYIGFTSVILNIFKIKKKINETVEEIVKFKPELTLKKGNYSNLKPNHMDQLNINKAIKTLKRLKQKIHLNLIQSCLLKRVIIQKLNLINWINWILKKQLKL